MMVNNMQTINCNPGCGHIGHGVDSDLEYAFEDNGSESPFFGIRDIAEVLALVPGEADELDWHWIVRLSKLANGCGYAYIRASCDMSGWGCQSSMDTFTGTTIERCLGAVLHHGEHTPIRQQLLNQIKGTQPYGLREE